MKSLVHLMRDLRARCTRTKELILTTILQAQQANTHLEGHQHDLFNSESSDKEEETELEVNTHN